MSYTTRLTEGHRAFLQQLFGREAGFDQEVLRVYASDASLLQGEVLAVVRPETTEQVRELMRFAQDERICIQPRGRGTSLAGGCVPLRPSIVVSMLGMDKILDISPTDFVAEVQPGLCTASFQQECEKLGLFYPPDPASGKASSIGGNVITCAGGLRAVKYGVTRDYLLGCDLVLPGGKLLQLGRRTHKDVVGLDITRLVAGSEGTLGILTRLVLKLIPKPESTASVLVGYPSLEAALSSMANVFAAGILPVAVEFMNETTLDVLRKTGDVPWPGTVNSLLLFQVDGSRETVPLENARLARQLEGALWKMEGAGKDEEALWAHRRRVTIASYVFGPDRISGDMAVPRGSLPTVVRRFEEIAAKNGKRLVVFGHAGDGNIHANLHYDMMDEDDKKRAFRIHHELDAVVLEFGGSISGEHGSGCLKDAGSQLGKDEQDLMRRIRAVFDPEGILNPGKAY